LLTVVGSIAYLVTGNAEAPLIEQLVERRPQKAVCYGSTRPVLTDVGSMERQVMEEFCAYCGEEIVADAIHQNDNVFCSQECLDAYNQEELLFMDEEERDDF